MVLSLRRPTRRRRLVAPALLAGLGAAAALSACTANTPPKPEAAATVLADGLATTDLSKVVFDGATPAAATAFVTTAIGDLKDTQRTVKVASVSKTESNDKQATATLDFTWNLGSSGAASPSTASTASTATASASTATTAGTATTDGPSPSTDTPSGTATGASTVTWHYTTSAKLSLVGEGEQAAWHVTWSPALFAPDLTANEHLTLAAAAAKRGDIIGADNTPLMTQRGTFQLGIDKTKVGADAVAASASALATLAGIDPAAYAKTVAAAGAKAFVVAITVRADDPLVTSDAGSVSAIPGAVSIPGTSVIGPSANFAKSLLGSVGAATQEIIAKSGGTLTTGDQVGLSGLEQRYDKQLRGTDGQTVNAVGPDATGTVKTRQLFETPAVDGKPLTISLDVKAQTVAEAVLQGSTTDTVTALVAIRPSTGEILAAANGPAAQGQQIATTGQAAPGSTFKIVTSLALLRAGLTPDSPVACTANVTVNGRVFKNYDDYPADKLGPAIPLRTAFANSCNTAFISNNDKVSQADLASAAASLGVGVDLDLGFPAFLGSVPTDATPTEHAASMIGQGKVLMAPLDMATVVASVLKGSTVRPLLVRDNPAVASFPTPAKPLDPAEAQTLQSLMGSVVTEGSGRSLADVGVTAAKTGTAEYGTATPPQTHAWMVAGKGDLAVAVYVENGVSGSRSAGPLLHSFLSSYS